MKVYTLLRAILVLQMLLKLVSYSSFVNVYFQLWINTYLERNTRTVYDRLKITTVSVGFFFIVFGHTINKDMQDLGYTCKMCS